MPHLLSAISAVLAFWTTAIIVTGTASARDIVPVCGEAFPPYAFFMRDDNGTPTDRLAGASIDLLSLIGDEHDIEFRIQLIPWKRCVAEVTQFGRNQKYEMFLDATANPERQILYAPTDVVYLNFQALYFSRKNYPDGLKGFSLKQLKNETICGLLGHSAQWLAPYSDSLTLEFTSPSLDSAFKRLHYQRCDLLGYSPSLVRGWLLISGKSLSADIDYVILPEIPPNRFHYWISRQSPRHEKLVTAIYDFIRSSRGDRYENIFRKYLSLGSGLLADSDGLEF